MPDSNPHQSRLPDDDDSIDLGHLEPVEEGASALSYTGAAGTRSGGSSSGIRSWEQLVREAGGDASAEHVNFNPSAPAEDASDKDLLREVLADEPPPSSIILKDPSQPDFVLPPEQGPTSGSFVLPPDLAATRPGDSSILGHDLPTAPGHSGFTSDLWGSSSGVDLFRPDTPVDLSSGSMQRTENLGGEPPVRPPAADSSHTLLGDGAADGDESSAVNLGSHPSDLAFPLGADGAVESSRRRPGRGRSRDDDDENSGTVDLSTPAQEFDVSLPESTTTPSWAAAREDLPPTVPMIPAGKARLAAWGGGGAIGLLAGVSLCAGLWLLGWVPGTTTTAAPPGPTDAQLAAARLRADEADVQARLAEKQRDELARKADAAAAAAKKAAADLKAVTGQLAQAGAAADQAKQAKERADALAAQVRQADAKRAELAASIETLTADKVAADGKVRTAEAAAARLRDQAEKADQAAKTARAALDRATAASKQAATFAVEVAQRLRVAPETDLLAALDRALARPTGDPGAAGSGQSAVQMEPVTTPQQAHYAAHAGYAALRSGDPAAAEREFARLAATPERTAIHFYYLGLAQWRQGEKHDAEESFRRGWALERDSKPSPAEVEAAFERLDRSEREVVSRYRR